MTVSVSMRVAESILAALAEPVLVLDEAFRAVLANSSFYKTFGIAPGNVQGRPLAELVAQEAGQLQLWSVLDAVVKLDTQAHDVEIECITPPDTRKVLSVSAKWLTAEEDRSALVIVEFRDITGEKAADQRVKELNDASLRHAVVLEEINNELESFAYSVSHDLRTPLRLMNKIAHLLIEEHGDQLPAGATDKIQMILNSTQEMGKLVSDLLALSQVVREPMKKRRVDARRLAREALAELQEADAKEGAVIIDDLPACRADRALLKQVFLNLLANALKFTQPRERPEIRVGFTQSDGETVYFVRDNGVGFDMSKSEFLFVAFHRFHNRTDFPGSGVGLALVKRIVDRHGGRVWAESEVDRGSTFYFTLGE